MSAENLRPAGCGLQGAARREPSSRRVFITGSVVAVVVIPEGFSRGSVVIKREKRQIPDYDFRE